jgi:hypothetical protein
MTEDRRFRQWDKWLDAIYEDVSHLVIGRHIYEEVRKIIASNARLHQPSSFYDLMAMTFSAWSAMAVRRQRDNRSISLVRLLGEVEKHPEIISRERFVDTFASKMIAGFGGATATPESELLSGGGAYVPTRAEVEAIAHKNFDRLVAPNAQQLDPERIRMESDELRAKAKSLEHFASKKIAHLDEQTPEIPTLPELDACTAAFEAIVLRYMMLLRASAPAQILPTWQYDWKAVFREAWLPEQRSVSGQDR